MKIGVTLPTFSVPSTIVAAAREAEERGIHGVFSFDHQWPLGHSERPSLSLYPSLGAVAAATSTVAVGSLVARVGLVPDEVVLQSLMSLRSSVGDRLIAGLGTGDEASSDEHLAYGLPYLGVTTRLERMRALIAELRDLEVECWVGAGRESTNKVARDCGVTLNLWGATPKRLRAVREGLGVEVSWGGPLPGEATKAADLLRSLEEAGATWAVWGWPTSLELVSETAAAAGVRLGES